MSGPAPTLVLHIEDFHFERIADGSAIDIDGPGERVDLAEIEIGQIVGAGIGPDLTDRFGAFDHNGIARVDRQARRDGVIPKGLGDAVIEIMLGHFFSPLCLCT